VSLLRFEPSTSNINVYKVNVRRTCSVLSALFPPIINQIWALSYFSPHTYKSTPCCHQTCIIWFLTIGSLRNPVKTNGPEIFFWYISELYRNRKAPTEWFNLAINMRNPFEFPVEIHVAARTYYSSFNRTRERIELTLILCRLLCMQVAQYFHYTEEPG
jgi:hypothetical protein